MDPEEPQETVLGSEDSETRFQPEPFGSRTLVGRVLGGYRLVAAIGAGGMGEIYKAYDPVLQKHFAVKTIKGSSMGQEIRSRFVREARLASRIDDPHVVPILKCAEEDDVVYCVMPFVEGHDLSEHLRRRGGRLEVAEVAAIAGQIARGLAAVHRAGIVHRDVKPSNVLIDAEGRVRVIDLGLARDDRADAGLTSSGRILGTPHYMSPEQAEGREAGPASDVYSLGLTIYYLLAGRPPYDGSSALEILNRQCSAPLPDVGRDRPDVPAGLVDLLGRMTAKDPDRRPGKIEEVAAALEAIRPVHGTASRLGARGRRIPLVAAGVALVVLAGAAIAVGILVPDREPEPSPSAAADPRPGDPDPVETEPPAVDPGPRPTPRLPEPASPEEARLRRLLGAGARILEADPLRVEATWDFDDAADEGFFQPDWDASIAHAVDGGALVARPAGGADASVNLNAAGAWTRPFHAETTFEYRIPDSGYFSILLHYFVHDGPSYRVDLTPTEQTFALGLEQADGDLEPIAASPLPGLPAAGRLVVSIDVSEQGDHRLSVALAGGETVSRIEVRDDRAVEGSFSLFVILCDEFRLERVRIQAPPTRDWVELLGE